MIVSRGLGEETSGYSLEQQLQNITQKVGDTVVGQKCSETLQDCKGSLRGGSKPMDAGNLRESQV